MTRMSRPQAADQAPPKIQNQYAGKRRGRDGIACPEAPLSGALPLGTQNLPLALGTNDRFVFTQPNGDLITQFRLVGSYHTDHTEERDTRTCLRIFAGVPTGGVLATALSSVIPIRSCPRWEESSKESLIWSSLVSLWSRSFHCSDSWRR